MMNILLLKYNTPGPRYTSYPPANFFHQGFDLNTYTGSLKESNDFEPANISIYIHIPFCRKLCDFCGCNTGIAKKREDIGRYINAVLKEIDIFSRYIDRDRKVTQIHWGGGTPNSIPFEYIGQIMSRLRKSFTFDPGAEIAMECSPAYLSADDIGSLAEMGFNRMSLGVQDFNDEVLKAVNRLPSRLPLEEVFGLLRKNNFKSINLDLMYGLPKQTPELFASSVGRAIELSPDRLATFSYAHVPWFNNAMFRLEEQGLPNAEEKMRLFEIAYDMLTSGGYESIGLDHYAKPDDELSIALRNRELHRNFQGYCTKKTTGQVYAFGASGITQLRNSYYQNIKDYSKYITEVENEGFAVERGYILSDHEIICRDTINSVMCNGYLDFDEIAYRHNITKGKLKHILNYSPEKFSGLIEDGLLTLDNDIMRLSRQGMLMARIVAMTLDPNLAVKKELYSKTI